MGEFNFPKNIKQMGGIDTNLRIYVEDYVMSYLNQYTSMAGYDERLAVFVGRHTYMDSLPVVIISGAILGKYTEEEEGRLVFGQRSKDYIEEQLNRYFGGLEVVGFMQSQPTFGTVLNPSYELDFVENYRAKNNVMLVMDPIEKINTFYIHNNEEVIESNGFFIYYDKNEAMNEYMQENKIVKTLRSSVAATAEQLDEDDNEGVLQFGRKEKIYLGANLIPKEESRLAFEKLSKAEAEKTKSFESRISRSFDSFEKEEDFKEDDEMQEEEADNTNESAVEIPLLKEPVIRKPRTKGTIKAQKRVTNMLITMSSVMLIITFVMAGALIRSEDRLNNLEEEFNTLTGAYINIIQSLQATQEAFAMANVVEEGVVIEQDGAQLVGGNTGVVSTPAGANFPATYTVQAGDNLLAISQMFYGTTGRVEDIKHLNSLDDADMIVQGMILQLPKP